MDVLGFKFVDHSFEELSVLDFRDRYSVLDFEGEAGEYQFF